MRIRNFDYSKINTNNLSLPQNRKVSFSSNTNDSISFSSSSDKCKKHPLLKKLGIILEEKFVFRPNKKRLPLKNGFKEENVSAKDGTPITVLYREPDEKSTGALIFLHGVQDNATYAQEHPFPKDKTIMLADYRGWQKGQKTGITEESICSDAQSCYEHLINTTGDKKPVVWAHSVGGGVGVELVSKEGNNPAGLIIDSTFTSLPDVKAYRASEENLKGKSILAKLVAKLKSAVPNSVMNSKFDNISKLSKVKCPVLILHSKSDEAVPDFMADKLRNELVKSGNTDVTLIKHDSACHDDRAWTEPYVRNFIERV